MAIAGASGWEPSFDVVLLPGVGILVGMGINVPQNQVREPVEAMAILLAGGRCYVSQFHFVELRRLFREAGLPDMPWR